MSTALDSADYIADHSRHEQRKQRYWVAPTHHCADHYPAAESNSEPRSACVVMINAQTSLRQLRQPRVAFHRATSCDLVTVVIPDDGALGRRAGPSPADGRCVASDGAARSRRRRSFCMSVTVPPRARISLRGQLEAMVCRPPSLFVSGMVALRGQESAAGPEAGCYKPRSLVSRSARRGRPVRCIVRLGRASSEIGSRPRTRAARRMISTARTVDCWLPISP